MKIGELNELDEEAFTRKFGPVFEESPWIARDTWRRRPFLTRDRLLYELSKTVIKSGREAQVKLIQAHPDLAGKLAGAEKLTEESTMEQAAAGLSGIDPEVKKTIQERNKAYRKKFSFPFVICARLNNVESILSAFDERIMNSRDAEIDTALGEIFKIARLRLFDLVD